MDSKVVTDNRDGAGDAELGVDETMQTDWAPDYNHAIGLQLGQPWARTDVSVLSPGEWNLAIVAL